MTLNDDRIKVGDRVERRVLYGPTGDFPTARGGGDLYYDTTIGDLYIDTGTWERVFSSVLPHTHDDRYYTETEVDALLHDESHTIASHNDTTATGAELETLTDGSNADSLHVHNYAAASHTHDDRYYTETETDSLLSGKSDTGHTHDSRYYTETEVDNLLDGYLPLSAGSGELLTGDIYFSYSATGRGVILKGDVGQLLNGVGLAASGDLWLASSGADTIIHCDTWVKVSGGYLDLDGNAVYMGGGTFYTEVGDIETGTTSGGDIRIGTGGKLQVRNSTGTWCDMVWMSGASRIFGNTDGGVTWVEGDSLKLYRYGYSGTAAPSTTQWGTAGSWGIHVDTDGGAGNVVFLVYNHGGTLYKVALT